MRSSLSNLCVSLKECVYRDEFQLQVCYIVVTFTSAQKQNQKEVNKLVHWYSNTFVHRKVFIYSKYKLAVKFVKIRVSCCFYFTLSNEKLCCVQGLMYCLLLFPGYYFIQYNEFYVRIWMAYFTFPWRFFNSMFLITH